MPINDTSILCHVICKKAMKQILKILPALLILTLGIIISFWIYSIYKKKALSEKENQISAVIENNYRDIQQELAVSFSSIKILRFIFEEQKNISKEDFKNFTSHLLKSNPGIKAFSWVPKITNEDRAVFENKISNELKDKVAITKRNSQNEAIANEESPFYFPVTYIEPLNENNKALGYNIYSEGSRQKTIDLAINKGEIVITPRIKIVQDTLGYSFLGIAPVFVAPEKTTTMANVKGLISAVFIVDNLINAALANSNDPKIAIAIVDVTVNKKELIFGNEALFGKTGQFIEKRMLLFGGRTWEINFIISPAYYQITNIKNYLIGGIAISFFLFMLLLVPFFRERRRKVFSEKLFQEQKVRVSAQQALTESEEKYKAIFEKARDGIIIFSQDQKLLTANEQVIRLSGYSKEEFLSLRLSDIFKEAGYEESKDRIYRLLKGEIIPPFEAHLITKSGRLIPMEISVSHLKNIYGLEIVFQGIVRDITERKRSELILNSEKYLLEIITQNTPFPKILEEIVLTFEALSEKTIASILLLNDDGIHVHYGAAPHLPEAYNNALEGETIGPKAGSCGTAAYRKEAIIVTDIEVDPLWDDYRELAMAYGLRACWSTPIINSTGKVLGTFAMYYREPRSPKEEDFKLIERATHLAKIAMERNQKELELEKSRKLLLESQKIGKVGGWELNIDTHEVIWTEEVFRIHEVEYNYEPTVEMGINYYAPESKPIIHKAIQRAIEYGEPYDLELEIITAKGNLRWVKTIGEADLEHRRVFGFFQDITERKQAEEKLKESEEKYRFMFANNPQPMWIYDLETLAFLEVNKAAINHYGYSREEFLSMTIADIRPKDDINALIKNLKQVSATHSFSGEWRHLKKNGEIINVEITSHEITFNGHKARHMMVNDITDRKKAEEKLQKNEKILQLFVEYSPASIAMFDKNMNYLAVSKRYKLDYNLGEQSLLGRSHYDVFPEITPEWKAIHKKCLAGEIIKADEDSFLRVDGNLDWLKWEIHPWYEKEGEIGGIILFSEVITERKQIEEKLISSKKQLEFISNHIPVFIAHLDANKRYKFVNKPYAALFGLSPADIIGKYANEILGTQGFETANPYMAIVLAGQPVYYEFNLPHLPNQPKVLSVRYVPEFNEIGHLEGFIAAITDITEQKKAEEDLKKSEKEFRTLAESMPQIVWITNADGWNIYFNQQWLDYTGLTLEESYGHGWNSPFHPDDQHRAWDAWQNAVTNNGIYSIEARLRRFDGAYRWWLVRGIPILNEKGEIVKWYGTCTDINTFKQVSEEIKILNAELEQRVIERTEQLNAVNKELQTFTYSVSHDLKAPLRGIDGYSNLLQELYADNLNEEARSFISSIRKGTAQMNLLIEDLLDYSRLERAELRIETIKIKTLLETLKSQFKTEFSALKYSVNINVPDIEITADSKGLTIALRNLIDNAIKFSKENKKPTIDISFKNKPAYWEIAVKDNGIGFDMKYKDRIFEIFQQLNLPEEFPGTGIGLAMVHKSMEKMGGNVWAESTSGKGATFYLEIPKK